MLDFGNVLTFNFKDIFTTDKKVKFYMARSLRVDNLLPQNVVNNKNLQ